MEIRERSDGTRIAVLHDKENKELEVPVRGSLPIDAKRARYAGFNPETLLLKKGSIRLKGYKELPCDIILERDEAIQMRDDVTIYADIFRPADDEKHPAIIAMSPYGKEIGTQWLDDTPTHAGVPMKATSGLQKFEGPDPAYWVDHGYAVINPDVRGAYKSEGIMLFFGSDYGRDGADIVEWAASQDWCNGRVGMSGNSWLAISQWFTAAQHPEHLAAIAPWEGLSDCYRDVGTRGGVMMPEFVKMLSDSLPSTENGGIEDCVRMMREHPEWNDYWEDKSCDMESITTPAYVVASYTNPIHVYGSIDGFNRISSKEKWLRIHNTGEWDDYYNKAHTEDLRKFFDHYLKGEDNGWEKTPRVRMAVLDPGGKDIVDRAEESFPPAGTGYCRLYLCAAEKSMRGAPVKEESQAVYDSSSRNGRAVFKFKVPEDMEMCGFMKLRLWVSAPDHDDMDLAVKVEKRNHLGLKYPGKVGPGIEIAAHGYIRVSMREPDESRSTEEQPVQRYRHIQKLKPGEIVPVDIRIWPMAMLFRKGDILQVTVSAYKIKAMWGGPFKLKMAKIELPKEGYTWMPKQKPVMITVGGCNLSEIPEDGKNVELPKDVNHGRHVIYTGGHYDSFLYVPIKERE
jgi:predicted acyl esterase